MELHSNTGRTNRSLMGPERTPSSQSAAEAVEPQSGLEYSTPESKPPLKLRHESLSAYQYSPLAEESDDIRILDLFPGERDDPIRARLETRSLSNRPSYEAISYAWGSKSDNAWVTVCEGGVDYAVKIPKSLYGALRQLRYRSEHRSIWADAICINQVDRLEKNHQVPLMRKIYQGTTMVLIWLGDDDHIPCGGHALFQVINRYSQRNKPVAPAEDRVHWSALGWFFMRPWFRRVWCLQEVILAPSAKVMLGEHSTSWEYVGLAAESIYSAPTHPVPVGPAFSGFNSAYWVYLMTHAIDSRRALTFLCLLEYTRIFLASDYRDKIYGILGIPTTDSDPDAGELFLQPDYTKTLSEVYVQCALTIIQKTRSVELLSNVQHMHLHRRTADALARVEADDTLVNVPSWVPRWHERFTKVIYSHHPNRDSNIFKACASLSLEPRLKTEVKGLELVTQGALITPVTYVSRMFGSVKDVQETANFVWVEAFDHLTASTTDPMEGLYALSTLLTAGCDWVGFPIEDREQHFADLLALIYNPAMLSSGNNQVVPGQARGRSTRESQSDETRRGHPNMLLDWLFRPRTDLAVPPAGKTGHANRFKMGMHYMCQRRRLVFTEDGHVGLGPEVTEPGDFVCILNDANVPLLLRPEADGNKFRLVGEAYVQGMMFGEITISEPEQIVLSDKPFVSLDELEAGSQHEQLFLIQTMDVLFLLSMILLIIGLVG